MSEPSRTIYDIIRRLSVTFPCVGRGFDLLTAYCHQCPLVRPHCPIPQVLPKFLQRDEDDMIATNFWS